MGPSMAQPLSAAPFPFALPFFPFLKHSILCDPRLFAICVSAAFSAKQQELPRPLRSEIPHQGSARMGRTKTERIWSPRDPSSTVPSHTGELNLEPRPVGGQEPALPLLPPHPGLLRQLQPLTIGRCWSDVTEGQPDCTGPRELPQKLLLVRRWLRLGGGAEGRAWHWMRGLGPNPQGVWSPRSSGSLEIKGLRRFVPWTSLKLVNPFSEKCF